MNIAKQIKLNVFPNLSVIDSKELNSKTASEEIDDIAIIMENMKNKSINPRRDLR